MDDFNRDYIFLGDHKTSPRKIVNDILSSRDITSGIEYVDSERKKRITSEVKSSRKSQKEIEKSSRSSQRTSERQIKAPPPSKKVNTDIFSKRSSKDKSIREKDKNEHISSKVVDVEIKENEQIVLPVKLKKIEETENSNNSDRPFIVETPRDNYVDKEQPKTTNPINMFQPSQRFMASAKRNTELIQESTNRSIKSGTLKPEFKKQNDDNFTEKEKIENSIRIIEQSLVDKKVQVEREKSSTSSKIQSEREWSSLKRSTNEAQTKREQSSKKTETRTLDDQFYKSSRPKIQESVSSIRDDEKKSNSQEKRALSSIKENKSEAEKNINKVERIDEFKSKKKNIQFDDSESEKKSFSDSESELDNSSRVVKFNRKPQLESYAFNGETVEFSKKNNKNNQKKELSEDIYVKNDEYQEPNVKKQAEFQQNSHSTNRETQSGNFTSNNDDYYPSSLFGHYYEETPDFTRVPINLKIRYSAELTSKIDRQKQLYPMLELDIPVKDASLNEKWESYVSNKRYISILNQALMYTYAFAAISYVTEIVAVKIGFPEATDYATDQLDSITLYRSMLIEMGEQQYISGGAIGEDMSPIKKILIISSINLVLLVVLKKFGLGKEIKNGLLSTSLNMLGMGTGISKLQTQQSDPVIEGMSEDVPQPFNIMSMIGGMMGGGGGNMMGMLGSLGSMFGGAGVSTTKIEKPVTANSTFKG